MNRNVNMILDRTKLNNLCLIAIITFFFISNLIIAKNQVVWLDETYTLNTTNQKIIPVIHSSLVMEMQPPLYFVLLKLWRTINNSYYWARIFSILIISLAILAFYKLLGLYFADNRKIFATLLFSINPFTYWAAQEIRVYGFAILLLILQHHMFFKYFVKDKYPILKIRIIYVLLCIISVSTNFYLIFPLIANFGLLIFMKKIKIGLTYLFDMLSPILTFIILAIFLPYQEISYFYFNDVFDQYGLVENFKDIIRKYNLFLSGMANITIPGLGTHQYHQIMAILIYSVFVYRIIKNWKTIINQHFTHYMIYVVFLTFCLLFQYIILKEDGTITRHAYYLYPMLYVVFLTILLLRKDVLSLSIIILLVLGGVTTNVIYYSKNQKAIGLYNISEYIKKNESPGEAFAFYKNLNGHVFKEFYEGSNKILYIPKPFNFTKPIDFHEYRINIDEDIRSFLKDYVHNNVIWLITDYNRPLVYDIDYNYTLIDNYFDKGHSIVFDSVFSNEYQLRKIVLLNIQ